MIFRHESFQLWEQKISGLLLDHNKDFLIIGQKGLSMMALGDHDKRVLKDDMGDDIVVHSLDAYNFLKVDPGNYLLFECAKQEDMIISVQ